MGGWDVALPGFVGSPRRALTRYHRPMPEPQFFTTREAFRDWLEQHHATETELVIRFYKKGSGKAAAFTYEEGILESLCFGWIDGIRRSVDAESYVQRFTPRKKRSTWSEININRFRELQVAGLVRPAGLAAFEARTDGNSGIYSFEQGNIMLEPDQKQALEANTAAWEYWEKASKSYRKSATWW